MNLCIFVCIIIHDVIIFYINTIQIYIFNMFCKNCTYIFYILNYILIYKFIINLIRNTIQKIHDANEYEYESKLINM